MSFKQRKPPEMRRQKIHPGLPPAAYSDPKILEQEIKRLFYPSWQWAGLVDDLQKSGGIVVELAGGLPIAVEGEVPDLRVSIAKGKRRQTLAEATADVCGHFIFVRLSANGPSLKDYLGEYASVLQHCSENFVEPYDVATQNWACNWKAGIEITLEGYHVPMVHGAGDLLKKGSNFVKAVPNTQAPEYSGPHSYQGGIMSKEMKAEMELIARRLKIQASTRYTGYDHFTLFPNMAVGLSGGNLCFLQIYTPLTPNRMRLRYAYIMARLIDPQVQPPKLVKSTLIGKWREYTDIVLGEDRIACEAFQHGVDFADEPALLGLRAEERVAHMHKFWREAMAGDAGIEIAA
jgi:choline monooxygenase